VVERFVPKKQATVEAVVERVLRTDPWALSILNDLRQKDPGLARHMFRVSYTSGKQAINMGFSPADVHSAVLGGALHDLEKPEATKDIPPTAPLTWEEKQRINREHTEQGAKLVRPHNETAAAMILAHHDHDYPKSVPEGASKAEKDLADLKMILALEDRADGVLKGRPYRNGGPCSQAEIQRELSCFPESMVIFAAKVNASIIDQRNTRRSIPNARPSPVRRAA
jgi:putative nucleotidyltransferase with HDIG domain